MGRELLVVELKSPVFGILYISLDTKIINAKSAYDELTPLIPPEVNARLTDASGETDAEEPGINSVVPNPCSLYQSVEASV